MLCLRKSLSKSWLQSNGLSYFNFVSCKRDVPVREIVHANYHSTNSSSNLIRSSLSEIWKRLGTRGGAKNTCVHLAKLYYRLTDRKILGSMLIWKNPRRLVLPGFKRSSIAWIISKDSMILWFQCCAATHRKHVDFRISGWFSISIIL